MENRKSPGINENPVEFYKEVFDLLKKDLQDIFNNLLFHFKITPKTWTQVIITLMNMNTANQQTEMINLT